MSKQEINTNIIKKDWIKMNADNIHGVIVPVVTPVSYTHLDVYKRQSLYGYSAGCYCEWNCCFIYVCYRLFIRNIQRWFNGQDVYKRQRLSRRRPVEYFHSNLINMEEIP